MNKDKVVGMLLGVAIGDKLGSVVEQKSGQYIEEKYGWITDYLEGSRITDDSELTIAVAEAMIESPFNMKTQVEKHIKVFKNGIHGGGRTTLNAIRDLANGCPWNKSGISGEGRGKGNGVAMKLAPIAPCILEIMKNAPEADRQKKLLEAFTFVRNLTIMTHNTEMAVATSFAHIVALLYCLLNKTDGLAGKILAGAKQGVKYARAMGLEPETDNIIDRFAKLENVDNYDDYPDVAADFGNLSCYCYDSVPGSHALFLRYPNSIEALYEAINAGGDTDSTGSMVGALLGALNGTQVFPTHLIDDLDHKEEIVDVAEKLCEKIGITS